MWILQSNLWKEEKYNQLISLLERYEIEHTVINLIPFSETIELPCNPEEVDMVFGSIRFVELAREAGVKVHFNDNFNYQVWSKVFKDKCLNWGSKLCRIGDINLPFDHDVFVRPVLDDKSFSGTVLRAGDTFDNVQFATSKVKEDIVIQVAPVKKIYTETRYFVVDEKVITGSIYRSRNRVAYQNIDVEECLAKSEWQFAQKMVNKWCPSDMFVIDIASTPDGPKIIEFGSIHNCGFYDIDLSKLIQEIQEKNEHICPRRGQSDMLHI